jgi:hypothetical protein
MVPDGDKRLNNLKSRGNVEYKKQKKKYWYPFLRF